MRKDTQASAHVQFPHDVSGGIVLEALVLVHTAVFAVAETQHIQASQLALGGDVVPVDSLPHTTRPSSKADPEAAIHSRRDVLPEERAVRRAKGQEHAAFFLVRRVHRPVVVAADIHRVAHDHRTAKRVVAQLDTPDDVAAGGRDSSRPADVRSASRPSRVAAPRAASPHRIGRPAIRTRPRRCDSRPTQRPSGVRDPWQRPARPPRRPVLAVRCSRARRRRRCAHRGIHRPARRRVAARRARRTARSRPRPHRRPSGRRASRRPRPWRGLAWRQPPSDQEYVNASAA